MKCYMITKHMQVKKEYGTLHNFFNLKAHWQIVKCYYDSINVTSPHDLYTWNLLRVPQCPCKLAGNLSIVTWRH